VSALEDRNALREQLKRHEGFRRFPYLDTVGKRTVGYGRNLDDVGIREHEAAYLLSGDITNAIQDLVTRYPWFERLDPVRQAVLVNMGFNLGATKLAGFKNTLACIERGQYGEASKRMLDSLWAQQVGKRAVELAAQMKTGSWHA
jgi:lysozyme